MGGVGREVVGRRVRKEGVEASGTGRDVGGHHHRDLVAERERLLGPNQQRGGLGGVGMRVQLGVAGQVRAIGQADQADRPGARVFGSPVGEPGRIRIGQPNHRDLGRRETRAPADARGVDGRAIPGHRQGVHPQVHGSVGHVEDRRKGVERACSQEAAAVDRRVDLGPQVGSRTRHHRPQPEHRPHHRSWWRPAPFID